MLRFSAISSDMIDLVLSLRIDSVEVQGLKHLLIQPQLTDNFRLQMKVQSL